jgi:NADPH:quinone reductase-like Zn-dependent oxidoreductase
MRAAVRDRYGSPDVVEVTDVDKPVPKDHEVLVKVHVASVNRADLDGIQPRPSFVRLFIGVRAPRHHRLGLDMAGVVEAVGDGVTRFRPGDRVFGDMYQFPDQGAFAEYVSVPERALLPIPDGMSFEHAATLPHSANLAVQSLRLRKGRTIKPGDSVLVDGASGNVGPFAVQIAKAMGAKVTGVASPGKLDLVRSLGADHVLDYTIVDYTAGDERYDWIVDTDSHHPIRQVRRALKPNGAYVTLGGTAKPIIAGMLVGPLVSAFSDRWSGLLLWWKPFNPPDIATVTDLIAAGAVRPAIDRSFPLSEVVEALTWVNDGKARGKVLVTVA